MKKKLFILMTTLSLFSATQAQSPGFPTAKIKDGLLEGTYFSGIWEFKGIPFAEAPVGNLRWKEPQPVKPWTGVRKADHFGPRAMQQPIFSDMQFRSDGISEDCLYLNIWTPARSDAEKLPVLVYFYGGGLMAGDGSELRYDGESMARKGIVAITVNYRLNIFGFFSHPELTKESPHKASGNYGFLDQAAALNWVKQNIRAFGGDPAKITIAGESAGSYSVSGLMASPLTKKIIAGAIGESGSLLDFKPLVTLAAAEARGLAFANSLQLNSLEALRALPAEQLLKAGAGFDDDNLPVDGYFFPQSALAIYTAGEQAKIPLLVGWNSEEGNWKSILENATPTKENFIKAVRKLYPEHAEELLKLYDAASDADVESVATDLASDRFISFSTWRWSDWQAATGGNKVYRYYYERARPETREKQQEPASKGATHSSEIEYALGNLPTNKVYDWQPEDYLVSQIMQDYFVHFIKTGNPNGPGLPAWPAISADKPAVVMHINVNTRTETEKNRARYLFLEKKISKN